MWHPADRVLLLLTLQRRSARHNSPRPLRRSHSGSSSQSSWHFLAALDSPGLICDRLSALAERPSLGSSFSQVHGRVVYPANCTVAHTATEAFSVSALGCRLEQNRRRKSSDCAVQCGTRASAALTHSPCSRRTRESSCETFHHPGNASRAWMSSSNTHFGEHCGLVSGLVRLQCECSQCVHNVGAWLLYSRPVICALRVATLLPSSQN